MKKEVLIPSECHGQRIDVVLTQLFPEYSRSQLSQWLKEGHITINETGYKPKDKVRGGEKVSLQYFPSSTTQALKAEAIPLEVIFEDADLLIINKPAGLVVHPGAGNPSHTLVNGLLHYDTSLEHLPRAGIIHRLDKDTTGLLIVAKRLEAYTQLVRQMQAREIQRRYQSLVYGHVIAGGRIETFFGRHPRNRLKMAVLGQGKEAVTEYAVKRRYQQFTLLDVKLLTGRTHQIRVHLSHIHHPIVGDPLYGGRLRVPAQASHELMTQLQQFNRQALHAYFLELQHPMTNETLTFTAPLPDDFQTLLAAMDESNG